MSSDMVKAIVILIIFGLSSLSSSGLLIFLLSPFYGLMFIGVGLYLFIMFLYLIKPTIRYFYIQ